MKDDDHKPLQRSAEFRFYRELNDFLSPEQRGAAFTYRFVGTPSVKDTVEAIGVPHTEVDLILVDGASVGFDHLLRGGERVAVYPMFERLDITPVVRLRPQPLRETRFAVDVNLGKLARYLRLLGFDTAWRNDLRDREVVDLSLNERRIILTRDIGILKRAEVTHGYWVRATDPRRQLEEVIAALQLENSLAPFSRCADCNSRLRDVDKATLHDRLPPDTFAYFDTFLECPDCRKLYWRGSHYDRLKDMFDAVLGSASAGR